MFLADKNIVLEKWASGLLILFKSQTESDGIYDYLVEEYYGIPHG